MKFGRRYKVTLQTTDATAIIIELPLTIQFNIHRSVSSSLNSMTLQLFNLSETHRNLIYQDRFSTERRKIIVEMGYESLSTVFVGDIYEANSTREGTNIITTIDARDGNFDTNVTTINYTYKAGSTVREIIEYLAKQFPNLKLGKVTANGSLNATFPRPVVLEGNVYELLKLYSNQKLNQPYVDLAIVNILGQNEVLINNNITLLNASTGLIATPRRDQSFLSVTTLLEPRVIIGQVLQVESKIMPQYNGLYKILGVTHKGIISGAQSGEALSVFEMNGNQLLGGFQPV
jgi:hypothetical protein